MELGFLFHILQIIEGSARVAGLTVEETFVQQARDPETDDALPLPAFTLHELLEWPSNKSLTLDGYKALGDEKAGLTPLENAVRRAPTGCWPRGSRLMTSSRRCARRSVHTGCFNAAASIGSFRTRLPVAAKIALATAGTIA